MRTFFWLVLFCFSFAGAARAAPGDELPREVTVNGVEFVHVSKGWFWYAIENHAMETAGQPGRPYYRDAKVWLDGFYMAKYEARARDFKRFMESDVVKHRTQYAEAEQDGCSVRRKADGEYYLVDTEKDFPATHLSWDLANEFARWMGFRLPTEAEWVKAARGTDRRIWPWGDEYPDDTFAGYNNKADCSLAPIDSFANGKSPYGAYNMAGSVLEWVQDWYNHEWDAALKDGARNPLPADQPTTPSPLLGPAKILRGGSWSSPANGVSIYRRTLHRLDDIFICFGTRFALDETTVRKYLDTVTAVPH